jgi:endonuclease YncB( thermonuclease family)
MEEIPLLTGCAYVQYGHIRDLTLDMIDCDTMDVRSLRQKSVLVEPKAKVVMLQNHGYHTYKRTLADVLLSDSTNVNHTLVKQGWCWWYRKYAPGDTVRERLEHKARKGRKGLWVDPWPVPPWEWRKIKR